MQAETCQCGHVLCTECTLSCCECTSVYAHIPRTFNSRVVAEEIAQHRDVELTTPAHRERTIQEFEAIIDKHLKGTE